MYYQIFQDMIGKVFDEVYVDHENDQLIFKNAQEQFTFLHHQDCCEHVYIESIVGDLSDLVGVPLTIAEEVCSEDPNPTNNDSGTWTFYKCAGRGYVDVRWYGSSNGYYSEGVNRVHDIFESPDLISE